MAKQKKHNLLFEVTRPLFKCIRAGEKKMPVVWLKNPFRELIN